MKKKGLVLRSTGSWYDLMDEERHLYRGRMRGKLKLKGFKLTNPIAVGDYVDFDVENEEAQTAIISNIRERRNFVVRQSTRQRYNDHILAANVDLALVMATFSHPRTSLGFIDRFLVAATSSNVPTTIIFNKSDLLSEDEQAFQDEHIALYTRIGYGAVRISALKEDNLNAIRELVQGKKVLIAGHSGVGKSTLVNVLAPSIRQRTAEISNFANKGVHTTTFAEMFEIAPETYLIDTPGIKELGIVGLEENQLGFYFPEIREAAEHCRYYNCTHVHEPNCEVKKRVEEEQIAYSRYLSYLSIFENGDNRR